MKFFKITLPYSNKTIYNSISKDKNPLKLLDLVDLFDGHKKINIVNSQRSGKNNFEIELSNTLNKSEVIRIFQNMPNQAYLCSEIRLYLQEGEYINRLIESEFTYESNKNYIDFDLVNEKSQKYGLAFIGFKQKTFFKHFNRDEIVKYIENEKSFNWQFNKKSIQNLTINHLTNIERINRKNLKFENFAIKKVIKNKNISASLNFDFNKNKIYQKIIFHDGNVQLSNSNFDVNVLLKKIEYLDNYKLELKNISKILSYHIEFDINGCEYNEDFKINHSDYFLKNFEDIILSSNKYLSDSTAFHKIIDEVSLFLKSQSSEKLNLRREKIKKSPKVFFKNELICKQPDNEQEVVMLFMILNSRKLTPFYYFNLLDYSTAEGIDAWADVQLFQDEMRSEKLIEFETTYKNFIKHGHYAKQVNLVICWKIEKDYKSTFIKHFSWLYECSEKKILIIEISALPGVVCKHE